MISRTLKPLTAKQLKEPGLYLWHPVVAFTDQPLKLVEVKRKMKSGHSYLIYCPSPKEERIPSGGFFFKFPKIRAKKKKKPKSKPTNKELNGGWKQGYANTDSMA